MPPATLEETKTLNPRDYILTGNVIETDGEGVQLDEGPSPLDEVAHKREFLGKLIGQQAPDLVTEGLSADEVASTVIPDSGSNGDSTKFTEGQQEQANAIAQRLLMSTYLVHHPVNGKEDIADVNSLPPISKNIGQVVGATRQALEESDALNIAVNETGEQRIVDVYVNGDHNLTNDTEGSALLEMFPNMNGMQVTEDFRSDHDATIYADIHKRKNPDRVDHDKLKEAIAAQDLSDHIAVPVTIAGKTMVGIFEKTDPSIVIFKDLFPGANEVVQNIEDIKSVVFFSDKVDFGEVFGEETEGKVYSCDPKTGSVIVAITGKEIRYGGYAKKPFLLIKNLLCVLQNRKAMARMHAGELTIEQAAELLVNPGHGTITYQAPRDADPRDLQALAKFGSIENGTLEDSQSGGGKTEKGLIIESTLGTGDLAHNLVQGKLEATNFGDDVESQEKVEAARALQKLLNPFTKTRVRAGGDDMYDARFSDGEFEATDNEFGTFDRRNHRIRHPFITEQHIAQRPVIKLNEAGEIVHTVNERTFNQDHNREATAEIAIQIDHWMLGSNIPMNGTEPVTEITNPAQFIEIERIHRFTNTGTISDREPASTDGKLNGFAGQEFFGFEEDIAGAQGEFMASQRLLMLQEANRQRKLAGKPPIRTWVVYTGQTPEFAEGIISKYEREHGAMEADARKDEIRLAQFANTARQQLLTEGLTDSRVVQGMKALELVMGNTAEYNFNVHVNGIGLDTITEDLESGIDNALNDAETRKRILALAA